MSSRISLAQSKLGMLLEQQRVLSQTEVDPDLLAQFGNVTEKLAMALDDLLSAHREAGHGWPVPDVTTMRLVQRVSERLGSLAWGAALSHLVCQGTTSPNARMVHEWLAMDQLQGFVGVRRGQA